MALLTQLVKPAVAGGTVRFVNCEVALGANGAVVSEQGGRGGEGVAHGGNAGVGIVPLGPFRGGDATAIGGAGGEPGERARIPLVGGQTQMGETFDPADAEYGGGATVRPGEGGQPGGLSGAAKANGGVGNATQDKPKPYGRDAQPGPVVEDGTSEGTY